MLISSYVIDRCSGLPTISKTDVAKLDYSFDFSQWLGTSDTIDTFNIVCSEPIGGDLIVEPAFEACGIVTSFISGGTVGKIYKVTCTITTADGRTDARTIVIKVVEYR